MYLISLTADIYLLCSLHECLPWPYLCSILLYLIGNYAKYGHLLINENNRLYCSTCKFKLIMWFIASSQPDQD